VGLSRPNPVAIQVPTCRPAMPGAGFHASLSRKPHQGRHSANVRTCDLRQGTDRRQVSLLPGSKLGPDRRTQAPPAYDARPARLAPRLRPACGTRFSWTGAGRRRQPFGAGVSRKAKGLGVMGDCGWGTDGSFPSSEKTPPKMRQ
jgi:hypothetical protein